MSDMLKVLRYYGLIDNYSTEAKILCPFHEDANPSMIVNEESFFCFGCQVSGDALSFVKNIEKGNGLNDLQACKKFTRILSTSSVNAITVNRAVKKEKSDKQLYVEAYDYYHGLKSVDWGNFDVMNEEEVEAREYMLKRGFTDAALKRVGAKVTYNRNYAIIFPLLDNGKFKGWDCRTTIKEIEQKRKYLYNKGFRRRNSLIGNYADCEVLFIVEGYMDMLKFIQFGVKNVACTLGWKMSELQIQKIKAQKKIKFIVSALDNDECGKKGSQYLKSVFGKKYIRFAFKKGFKDPGEMQEKDFLEMYSRTMKKIEEKKRSQET